MTSLHKDRSLAASSPPLTQPRFRKILLAFAVTLGIADAWTLMSELARPPRIGFPIIQNYPAAAEQRPKAALAARLGLVRGDLWAELFFSFADSIVGRSGRDFGAITTLNEAVPAAQRALAYAPYRSEVWLLLADLTDKYELPNPKSGAALTMSYYTAPYNLTLTPLRLSVATRGDALRDADLQQFVERDLRMILAGKPELRPAIIAAYATASAEGRRLVESVVQEADPSFLASLQMQIP
jgi:hypothetical protein